MHLWLANFPTSPTYAPLKFIECDDPVCQEECMLSEPCTIVQPAMGLTKLARRVFYLAALLPKLLVGIVVLIGGAGAVLRSEDNFNLILNTLSAVFVNEIDDIAYRALTPVALRQAVSGLPPIGCPYLQHGAGAFALSAFCGSYSTLLIVIAVNIAVWRWHC